MGLAQEDGLHDPRVMQRDGDLGAVAAEALWLRGR